MQHSETTTPTQIMTTLAEGVLELAARWYRSFAEEDLFTAGRREGYVQAISLVMGKPHAQMLEALRRNAL